jgi:hypothetical protein
MVNRRKFYLPGEIGLSRKWQAQKSSVSQGGCRDFINLRVCTWVHRSLLPYLRLFATCDASLETSYMRCSGQLQCDEDQDLNIHMVGNVVKAWLAALDCVLGNTEELYG